MAYIINRFNGTELTVLEDGTIDTTTSLGLVGRNYVGYGETQNENYVFLLENFANDAPPARPLSGQLWYDSVNDVLNAYNGTEWLPVGNAVKSVDEPTTQSVGQLWLKDNEEKQLFAYDGTTWQLIGPDAVTGFGTTRAVSLLWRDINNGTHPVIALTVNGNIQSIVSQNEFQWRFSDQTLDTPVNDPTQRSMSKGINMIPGSIVVGTLSGNATTASRLENGRTINGVFFDGTTNIALKASTTNRLLRGTYLTGNAFDGSTEQTWSVNATPNNTQDTVVARNNAGGFSAGTITANLAGNVNTSTGLSTFNDVNAVEVRATRFVGSTLTGNAFSATQLAAARTINSVPFNGTADIVVSAAAGTLTGSVINGTVVDSNLRSVGTLTNLVVAPAGISVGANLRLREDNNNPVIESTTDKFTLGVKTSLIDLWSAAFSESQGWEAVPTASPVGTWNLGNDPNKFNKIYAVEFKGNADTATTSTNLTGGVAGSIPYQQSAGITTMLPIGTVGQTLRVGGIGLLEWQTVTDTNLSIVAGTTAGPIISSGSGTGITIPTASATASGVVTTGAQTWAGTKTFNDSITANVTGSASNNVLKAGDTMSGDINWNSNGRGLNWAFNTDGASIRFYNSGDADIDSRLEFETKDNNNEYFKWSHTPSGGTNYETMRLVTNGPNNARLTVSGDIFAGNATFRGGSGEGGEISLWNAESTGVGAFIDITSNNTMRMFNNQNTPIAFYTNGNNERMRIDANGNVGINAGGVLTAKLTVNGTSTFTGTVTAPTFIGALTGTASNNVSKAGDTMTNFLTLHANPVQSLHAATKQYVDTQFNENNVSAWVRFRGSNGQILGSKNVVSVSRTADGRYTINIASGVFSNGNFAAAGMASDTDHFVAMESYGVGGSSNATQLFIRTVDAGFNGNDQSSDSAEVTVIMVG